MLRKKEVLQESLLCVDWQRYSKRFQENIRNTIKSLEFGWGGVFQMPVSGEVWDDWKEPSKYCKKLGFANQHGMERHHAESC